MPASAVAYALTRADAYAPAHEHFEHLIAQLHSPEVHQMTHSELEALLEVEGRETVDFCQKVYFHLELSNFFRDHAPYI